jgi:hypothetical protein
MSYTKDVRLKAGNPGTYDVYLGQGENTTADPYLYTAAAPDAYLRPQRYDIGDVAVAGAPATTPGFMLISSLSG